MESGSFPYQNIIYCKRDYFRTYCLGFNSNSVGNERSVSMETYCQNPLCQNKAVKEVRMSVDKPCDQVRALCATCEEAYAWGVQHGRAQTEVQSQSYQIDTL